MFKIGNPKIVKDDLENFNERYTIERILTKSANGILFTGKRTIDEKKVIFKVVPKDKCHRFGVMKDRNGLDRVVPIEFDLHVKAR